MKKGGGEFLQDLTDDFPIGGTEISAEGLTTRKKSWSAIMYEKAPMISGCSFIWRKADLTSLAWDTMSTVGLSARRE